MSQQSTQVLTPQQQQHLQFQQMQRQYQQNPQSLTPQQVLQLQQYQQRLQQNAAAAGQLPLKDQLQRQKQAKQRLLNYKFDLTSEEILAKYAKYAPSLQFHIYDSHYRFNSIEDAIISKNNPMIKNFLKNIINEMIPVEMCEVLRDGGIQFYEGCIILEVFDHRGTSNPVDESGDEKPEDPKQEETEEGKADLAGGATSTALTASAAEEVPAHNFKSYKTVLKPTQLSTYYDLLYQTDSALTRFTDQLSIQMESEILSLTKRSLDLKVPLNPYLLDDYLKPEVEPPKVAYDKKRSIETAVFNHRDPTMLPNLNAEGYKNLHQDNLAKNSSEYERLMTILNPFTSESNKDDSNSTNSKFMRLRFLQDFKKRKLNGGVGFTGFSLGNVAAATATNNNNNNPNTNNNTSANTPSNGISNGTTPVNNSSDVSSPAPQMYMKATIVDKRNKQVKKPKMAGAQGASPVAGKTLPGAGQYNVAGKTLPGVTTPGGPGTGKKRGSYKKKNKDGKKDALTPSG